MGDFSEVYLTEPTPFLVENWSVLLPDWDQPPQSLVIIIIKSLFLLDRESPAVDRQKDQLLDIFLGAGKLFYDRSRRQRYISEIISPKDGTPVYSRRGEITVDLVALIYEALDLSFMTTEAGCKVLIHPDWYTAMYPGIFLSQAPLETVGLMLEELNIG
jgi:hypothetical protein